MAGVFALLGRSHKSFFLTVETIVATFIRLVGNGILLIHASSTLLRLILAFFLAALVGVGLGIIIGRYRWAEDFFLPLVSIGNPIPGLAYAPLFVLWFGLGNLPAVLLVAFAAAFPIVLNTWTGRESSKRDLDQSGAGDGRGGSPALLEGCPPRRPTLYLNRLETGTGSRLASAGRRRDADLCQLGLGWLIFGAREFLNTDVMLAGIAVIGLVGFLLEKLVFQKIEEINS